MRTMDCPANDCNGLMVGIGRDGAVILFECDQCDRRIEKDYS
jgi:hypothetical protein